jgi:hypothetical protein
VLAFVQKTSTDPGVARPRLHKGERRRGGIADIGKYFANMHRQPHLWGGLCTTGPRRLRHLVANRQGRLDRPLRHLVERQRQPKGDDVQEGHAR